jgi:hypothetical protein
MHGAFVALALLCDVQMLVFVVFVVCQPSLFSVLLPQAEMNPSARSLARCFVDFVVVKKVGVQSPHVPSVFAAFFVIHVVFDWLTLNDGIVNTAVEFVHPLHFRRLQRVGLADLHSQSEHFRQRQ